MQEGKSNATVDFLNEISNVPFEEKKIEAETETEGEGEQETGEEKPLPFHQDPKVQRFIEKQVEKRLKDFKPSAEQTFRKETDSEIKLPDSFIRLVGNDTEEKKQVLKDLSNYFGTLKGEARQEFLAEMREQEQKQVEQDNAVAAELDEAFENIEETYNVDLSSNSAGAKQLRAQFIEYVRKIAPKDANGEVVAFPDMDSAFEIFQERNKRAPAVRAKELASRGLTRSADTATVAPTGRSWKDVDKFFGQLKANN